MMTELPSQSSLPGATRNFTITIAAIRISSIVAKIAMPPPRGIGFLLCLSPLGFETKPVLRENFLTTAVKRAEVIDEPMSNMLANIANFSILTAPIISF